jgi:hypothetical protein
MGFPFGEGYVTRTQGSNIPLASMVRHRKKKGEEGSVAFDLVQFLKGEPAQNPNQTHGRRGDSGVTAMARFSILRLRSNPVETFIFIVIVIRHTTLCTKG